MASADNFCKQFGTRSAPTGLDQNCLTLMVFLKEFSKNVFLKKESAYYNLYAKLPGETVKPIQDTTLVQFTYYYYLRTVPLTVAETSNANSIYKYVNGLQTTF